MALVDREVRYYDSLASNTHSNMGRDLFLISIEFLKAIYSLDSYKSYSQSNRFQFDEWKFQDMAHTALRRSKKRLFCVAEIPTL